MSHPQYDQFEEDSMALSYDDSLPPPDLRQHPDHDIILMLQSERGGKERAYLSEVIRLRALVEKLTRRNNP